RPANAVGPTTVSRPEKTPNQHRPLSCTPSSSIASSHDQAKQPKDAVLLPVAPPRGAPAELVGQSAPAPQRRPAPERHHGVDIPRQLPPVPHGFEGRREELRRIQDELELRSRAGVVFSMVITGMGGVGKT